MKHISSTTLSLMLAFVLAFAFVAGLPDAALAQVPMSIYYPPEYASSCSYNPQFNIPMPAAGTGIISLLVANISGIINNVGYSLYTQIIGNPSFQLTVRAAMTLFIVIYGILFTFGMTQLSMMDFTIRAMKFGIIATLLSDNSWVFFYSFVGKFFSEGTDWMIAQMSMIALGAVQGLDPRYPFAVLDSSIAVITSSRMFVMLIATMFTGPYGIIIGLMIIMGLGTFISALFQAMWVYLMSLVVRAFLFALAPIFFAFLLFGKTRHLFDGWLNALVSSMLQPVFLFTFFAFFSKLAEASLYSLLKVPVCFTPPGQTWQGTPFQVEMWRYMVPLNIGGVWRWEMYGGGWSFTGADMEGAPIFPQSIMDVIMFLIIMQLAWRFNGSVLRMAQDFSGVSLNLTTSGAIGDWMNPAKGKMDQLGGAANKAAAGVGGKDGKGLPNKNDPRDLPGGRGVDPREQMAKMPANRPKPK